MIKFTENNWREWLQAQVNRDRPRSIPIHNMLLELCCELYAGHRLVSFARQGILLWPRCTPGENLDPLPDDAQEQVLDSLVSAHLSENEKESLGNELSKVGVGSIEQYPAHPERFAFKFAGGWLQQDWFFKHLYDGSIALGSAKKRLNALKRGKHFTQTAGMAAIHPIVQELYEAYPCLRRTLQARSFASFGYDPEHFFSQCEHTAFGFVVPEEHPSVWAERDELDPEHIEPNIAARPFICGIRGRIAAMATAAAAARPARPVLGGGPVIA
jgi:hypothetical protein